MTTTAKPSTPPSASRSSSPTSDWGAKADEEARQLLAESATERPRPRRLPFSPVMRMGCRTFSASLFRERELLGTHVTGFIGRLRRAGGQITDYQVLQSSDNGYHCLSIVLFYEVDQEAAEL